MQASTDPFPMLWKETGTFDHYRSFGLFDFDIPALMSDCLLDVFRFGTTLLIFEKETNMVFSS